MYVKCINLIPSQFIELLNSWGVRLRITLAFLVPTCRCVACGRMWWHVRRTSWASYSHVHPSAQQQTHYSLPAAACTRAG